MKKTILIIVSVGLVLTLSLIAYIYIWGGKPQIENFKEISDDYEIVAQFVLDSYSELKPYDPYPGNELIIIDIYGDDLEHNTSYLSLTETQKNAVLTVGEKFSYLSVYEDAVFFEVDETGYYGLVYSQNPLLALYEAGLPQQGREYHRINRCWYEWGVWGI